MIRTEYYKTLFNDYLRNKNADNALLSQGEGYEGYYYLLPTSIADEADKVFKGYNLFREHAKVIPFKAEAGRIFTFVNDGEARIIKEGDTIPVDSSSFERICLENYKLASTTKINQNFIYDAGFDVAKHIALRLAERFAKAEEKVLLNGTGENEPKGLLSYDLGSIGSSSITYDSLVALYFALGKDYRKNAVWIMNDETLMAVRLLTDVNGTPIYDMANNTLFGKPVAISDHMEDAAKPILFGDLSYFWFLIRKPLAIKVLKEIFGLNGEIGYQATEFLDAHLTDINSVKALVIGSVE